MVRDITKYSKNRFRMGSVIFAYSTARFICRKISYLQDIGRRDNLS